MSWTDLGTVSCHQQERPRVKPFAAVGAVVTSAQLSCAATLMFCCRRRIQVELALWPAAPRSPLALGFRGMESRSSVYFGSNGEGSRCCRGWAAATTSDQVLTLMGQYSSARLCHWAVLGCCRPYGWGSACAETTRTEGVPSCPAQNFLFQCHRWKAGRQAEQWRSSQQTRAGLFSGVVELVVSAEAHDFSGIQRRREEVGTGLKRKTCAGMHEHTSLLLAEAHWHASPLGKTWGCSNSNSNAELSQLPCF